MPRTRLSTYGTNHPSLKLGTYCPCSRAVSGVILDTRLSVMLILGLGHGLEYQTLGLGFETQVLGLDLGLKAQVFGLGLAASPCNCQSSNAIFS